MLSMLGFNNTDLWINALTGLTVYDQFIIKLDNKQKNEIPKNKNLS